MDARRHAIQAGTALIAATLGLTALAGGVTAHLGETSHIHDPAQQSTAASAVWCVRFTQDPASWPTDGPSTIAAADLGDTGIILVDCSDVLDGDFAVESFEDGRMVRSEVAQPVLAPASERPAGVEAAAPETTAQAPDEVEYLTSHAWTRHQRQWLHKGDQLVARLGRSQSLTSIRQALGALQRSFRAETLWLRRNASDVEPDSCIARDWADWAKRVKQAQVSLGKTAAALARLDVTAIRTQARQFQLAYNKVQQIYMVGRCEPLG
jgi:hypothetical protein